LAVARNAESDVGMYEQIIRSDSEYINRHYIEWMRKFSLSVACLLLFFIGAPFGSIVRKGGLGMPLVASVIFFVLYYVVGMIGEKSVREGAIGPVGMWISTFVFIPIGALFTYQATTDVNVFDLARWRKWLGKVFRKR
jgi:lipopolysaccharide export system permease protein